MARRRTSPPRGMNLDSLVDIVSNNVGILIILAAFMGLMVLIDPAAQQGAQQEQVTEPTAKKLRVPWSHATNKETVYFYLHQNRLATLDLRPFYRELARRRPREEREPERFELAHADLRFFPVTNQVYCLEFEPHRNAGEPWLAAQRAGSDWQQAQQRYPAEDFVYFFWVTGDSFELFRELRAQLWDQNHEVGWRPAKADAPLELCTGFDSSRTFQPQ